MLLTPWLRFLWSEREAIRRYLADQPFPPYRALQPAPATAHVAEGAPARVGGVTPRQRRAALRIQQKRLTHNPRQRFA